MLARTISLLFCAASDLMGSTADWLDIRTISIAPRNTIGRGLNETEGVLSLGSTHTVCLGDGCLYFEMSFY